MTRFTRSFAVSELACRDGSPVPAKYYANAKAICERAQVLRDLCGPLTVNSGYRTPDYNERIGGADKSQHLTASALDLSSSRWTAEQMAELYEGLIRLGLVPDGGLGVYPSRNFLHIDVGPPRRWRG